VPFTLLTLKNQGNPATSSAIFMKKMSFHEKQVDKVPTKSSLKKEMQQFCKGVECHEDEE
jgi:hypothetical protein